MNRALRIGVTAMALWLAFAEPASAQVVSLNLGNEGTATGRLLQLLALVTVLSLAPSILVMVTSFTRIVIVLSFLRSAIGLQQTPPNAVLVSLALFLTAFIMAPVAEQAYRDGIKPLMAEQITEAEAFQRTAAPSTSSCCPTRATATWNSSSTSRRRT